MPSALRILSLCGPSRSDRTVSSNIAYYLSVIKSHRSFRPDVIVLPEHATSIGVPFDAPGAIQETNGEVVEQFASLAADMGTYMILPLLLPDPDRPEKRFNSALCLDRAGSVIGRYDKTYPTHGECSRGATPGSKEQNVIQTDFGPIGIAICYDSNFQGIWKRYAEQEARVVFWPSAWYGGMKLNGLAAFYNYHIVTATFGPCMRHINPLGENVIASHGQSQVLETQIDLDEVYVDMDYTNRKINDIRSQYADRLLIEPYPHCNQYRFLSLDESVETRAILREFDIPDARCFMRQSQLDVDIARQTGEAKHFEPEW